MGRQRTVLVHKKIDRGEFIWPRIMEHDGTITLSAAQLAMLTRGHRPAHTRMHMEAEARGVTRAQHQPIYLHQFLFAMLSNVLSRMQFYLESLPSDATMLHHLMRDMADDIAQRDDQIERLKLITRKLQRVHYGARSERLSEDHLALEIEDSATDAKLAAVSTPAPTPMEQPAAATPRRKALPEHLPRVDRCVDLEASTCDCGGKLHSIGESVSEMLGWVPALLRVPRIPRPKYGCRACDRIRQALALARTMVGTLADARAASAGRALQVL